VRGTKNDAHESGRGGGQPGVSYQDALGAGVAIRCDACAGGVQWRGPGQRRYSGSAAVGTQGGDGRDEGVLLHANTSRRGRSEVKSRPDRGSVPRLLDPELGVKLEVEPASPGRSPSWTTSRRLSIVCVQPGHKSRMGRHLQGQSVAARRARAGPTVPPFSVAQAAAAGSPNPRPNTARQRRAHKRPGEGSSMPAGCWRHDGAATGSGRRCMQSHQTETAAGIGAERRWRHGRVLQDEFLPKLDGSGHGRVTRDTPCRTARPPSDRGRPRRSPESPTTRRAGWTAHP